MPRYSVSGAVVGSTWIGEYDANDAWQAIEFARNDADVSLCHECARSVSDPEVCELTAEDVETGDSTSEATTNDQIVEQAKEIARLRRALTHIADTCVQDPDTAQFAARVLDGSADVGADVGET